MPSVEAAKSYLAKMRQAAVAKAKESKNPLLWMQAAWRVANKPYTTERYPYLEEIGKQTASEVSIMSSAGSGKTEFFLPLSLYWADCGERVLYCFETDRKAAHIVAERVNKNIAEPGYLAGRCDDADNVSFKRLGQGYIYFLGLASDSATTTYHGDKLILDELDKMDQTRVALMPKRLESSDHPKVFRISNPTFPEIGIDSHYKRGDQRRWHVPCSKCKIELPLNFWTHYDRAGDHWYCPSCGDKSFNRLAPGRWIATNPKGDHPSYHITGAMNPSFRAKQVSDELDSPKPDIQEAAYRMSLGEAFETAENGLMVAELKASGWKTEVTKIAHGGFLTCDPGKLFDVQIYQKPNEDGIAVCTWAGTVKGFNELEALVYESGVIGGVLDYMPELTGAKEFCVDMEKRGRNFWRAAYSKEAMNGVKMSASNVEPRLIDVNRTLMADQMVAMVRGKVKEEGTLAFAAALTEDEKGRWFKHMRSPRREITPGPKGMPVVRWKHEESRPDHQWHCTLYAAIWLLFAGGGSQLATATVSSKGW